MVMTTTTVAATIAEQIGRRTKLAINARNFIADTNALRLDAGWGAATRRVVITLNSWDTYDVEVFRLHNHGLDVKLTDALSGVYADQLNDILLDRFA